MSRLLETSYNIEKNLPVILVFFKTRISTFPAKEKKCYIGIFNDVDDLIKGSYNDSLIHANNACCLCFVYIYLYMSMPHA